MTSCPSPVLQVTGRSNATSVVCLSPRRETYFDTSSCTQEKNPSNAPSATTPVDAAMPSPVICALILVSLFLSLLSSLFTHPRLLPRRVLSSEVLQGLKKEEVAVQNSNRLLLKLQYEYIHIYIYSKY